jgi:hypothetical protein
VTAVGEGAYRVVEVSPVAEDSLAQALNDQDAAGWSFESLHFVTREGSHRPALAYLFFVRSGATRRRAAGASPGRRKARG